MSCILLTLCSRILQMLCCLFVASLGLIVLKWIFLAHQNTYKFNRLPYLLLASPKPIPCQPSTNIMFLKTHKTGSSTILNILFRFAEKRNLTVALPIGKKFSFSYPSPFLVNYVEDFQITGPNHNIMGNHLRFNFPEVQKIMPRNTFFFSILRNPISLLESSYIYFRFAGAFKRTKTLNEFLASPLSYYNPRKDIANMVARNFMWFDFGYDNDAEDTEGYVHSKIEEIEERFQLILIADYFDESMVLLKNTLCWDLDDVVYFKLNSRSWDSIQTLSLESRERAKGWCSLDWQLYRHFNETFWRKIEATIGLKDLVREVELLRERQEELMAVCIQDEKAVEQSQIKERQLQPVQSGLARILGYNLKPYLDNETRKNCHRMILPEFPHTNLMYKRQFPQKSPKIT
uniref:Galactose-3-O-sulfotransferase 2 n=1 Tax=Ornithorhynchus anatinus TaxID=9258 RepID=F6YIV9_ORNAN